MQRIDLHTCAGVQILFIHPAWAFAKLYVKSLLKYPYSIRHAVAGGKFAKSKVSEA